MLIPKKDRNQILFHLFKEGVLVAKKEKYIKHPKVGVLNLHVIKLMQSMVSRKYVKESFCWRHYYWFLTNEGVEYLRGLLKLPEEIAPATHIGPKNQPKEEGTRSYERGGGRGGGSFNRDSESGYHRREREEKTVQNE